MHAHILLIWCLSGLLLGNNLKINIHPDFPVKLDNSLVLADFLDLVIRKGDILAVDVKSLLAEKLLLSEWY